MWGTVPPTLAAVLLGALLLNSLLVLSIPVPVAAQSNQLFDDEDEIPEVLVTFESRVEPALARPGEHVRLVITAEIADGWYIYSLEPQGEFAPPPTLVTVASNSGLAPRGPAYEVNPQVKTDQVFDMTLAFHKKAARFYQNFEVPEREPSGELPLNAVIRYQACNDRICTPPRKEPILAALNVESGPVRPAHGYMQRTARMGSLRTRCST